MSNPEQVTVLRKKRPDLELHEALELVREHGSADAAIYELEGRAKDEARKAKRQAEDERIARLQRALSEAFATAGIDPTCLVFDGEAVQIQRMGAINVQCVEIDNVLQALRALEPSIQEFDCADLPLAIYAASLAHRDGWHPPTGGVAAS